MFIRHYSPLSLFTLFLYWINMFTIVHFEITVFFCLFFSGLMALLLSRSKPRTARPPASQACYEKPSVSHMTVAGTLSQATDWCLTTCYQTTVAEIWEDFLTGSGLHFISFSRLLPDCLLSLLLIVVKQLQLLLYMYFTLSDGCRAGSDSWLE